MDWELSARRGETLPCVDLHRERREARGRIRRQSGRDILALGMVTTLALGVLVPLTRAVLSQRAAWTQARQERASLDGQTRRLAQSAQQSDAQIARVRQADQERQARQVWADTVRTLAARTPVGISFEHMQITGKGPHRELSVGGRAETVALVTRFVQSISSAQGFSQVRLTETSQNPQSPQSGVRFALTARADGGASSHRPDLNRPESQAAPGG